MFLSYYLVLPNPKSFNVLNFWRLPEDYLCPLLIMRTLFGHFKEGLIGVGLFMIKLIWSHYEPVTKLSMVSLCVTTFILPLVAERE